jgi:outer membrane protein OmpU
MKNILLASTALVAFAGAAVAEVTISGSGRMGVVYDEGINNSNFVIEDGALVRVNDSGLRFSSRVRVAFTLTQETDAGVTFGASIRADNAADGNRGEAGSVFMSGAFGKLSMGDVDGAAEAAVGNLSGVGYTGLNDLNEAFYLQQGNSDLDSNDEVSAFALPAALYEYTTGPASFYISLGNPAGIGIDGSFFETDTTEIDDLVIDSAFGLGAKYSVDNYSVGIGYESIDISGLSTDTTTLVTTEIGTNIDHWILGGSATFGGFTLKAQYGEASGDLTDLTQYGLSGDYTFDAFTVTAFWRHVELKDAANNSVEREPFGMGVTYDLGGGASVAAGVVDPDIQGEDYRADLGVNFSF